MNETIAPEFRPLVDAVEAHLLGKRHAISLTLAAFFAGGHVLLEDIPGVGKTTLAKTFANVMGLDFGRVQFTGDLLPSDILGVSYFDQESGKFVLKKGPIFTQFLLADEINRSMPKTQSALLEAMEEHHVTIDGKSHDLKEPFFVIATQNPHEEVGTFALPHSQLDRFLCSFGIGYPDKEAERAVLLGGGSRAAAAVPLMDAAAINTAMEAVRTVHLSPALIEYLQSLIAYTRDSGRFVYGLSTRGALALAAMTRAWAHLHGRDYAVPDDVQAVLGEVCLHRLAFKEGVTTLNRIRHELFSHVPADA
ncbi:AAA family ATPase [Sulfurimonas sp. HSL-3221]|uniref:AAA family ATPase n=1 Tax=Sulfurimonadaceae TaxID=2771471 RepID=UPI001E4F26A5|nr:AAA family ATPase [Sulfurimonas sp. HSL-3221]UFS62861.1 AAA family ATPase [Sulfurimonas sp. HSL-3221]